MVHMDGNRVRFQFLIDPVELFFQDGLRHDPALPPQQVLQDCALATGQLQRKFAYSHVSSDRIQYNIARLELDAKCSTGPPQKRLGAGNELNRGEGFYKVVVRAGIQSRYPVL